MRKFHVFVGERYFVVQAECSEEYNGHLVFTRPHDDYEFIECARFKSWDSYVEILGEYERSDCKDSEASKPCA